MDIERIDPLSWTGRVSSLESCSSCDTWTEALKMKLKKVQEVKCCLDYGPVPCPHTDLAKTAEMRCNTFHCFCKLLKQTSANAAS